MHYALSDLSPREHLALNYCLARLEPERFAQPFIVVWQHHVRQVGEQQARQDRNAGFEGLLAKGVVEGAKRDGHRDWDVVGGPGGSKLRLDMLTDGRTLLTAKQVGVLLGDGE